MLSFFITEQENSIPKKAQASSFVIFKVEKYHSKSQQKINDIIHNPIELCKE